MPLTPFHLGPALFFGLLLFSVIHLPTFLVANIIVDLEPLFVLLFQLDYPLHGFFHSLLGSSMIAVALSLIMVRFDERIQKIMRFFNLEQQFSPRSIWFASFSGVYIHIILDSRLYTDIKPFFPLDINPFYSRSMLAGFEAYGFCLVLFIFAIGLYVYKQLKYEI